MEQDSYAKVNIFLKITGKVGGYHTLSSRFMLVKNISDTLIWNQKDKKGFESTFETALYSNEVVASLNQDNTILKAKKKLEPFLTQEQRDILEHSSVHVIKRVPMAAGLGGGSANAATFLHMAQQQLKIELEDKQWNDLTKAVGADVPFFFHNVISANVGGIGEEVVGFDEEILSLEIMTPSILCHTATIFKHYSQHFLDSHPCDPLLLNDLMHTKSISILKEYKPQTLNDLSLSVFDLYPDLKRYTEEGWFLSGSGSSFFRLKD